MDPSPAEIMKARLRSDLTAAMRAGEKPTVAVLRELIAELDNAEAVAVGQAHQKYAVRAFGDRSAEAPRRLLSSDDIQAILVREQAASEAAAVEMDAHGQPERAATLRAAALLIGAYRD